MTKAFLLSEETKAILDAMIEERVKRLLNTAGRRWIEPDDNIQAPEVYLARIPGAGIAALTLGGDTGTGTGTAAADDVVGSAECEIYRLLSVSGVPTFASCGFVRKVYNTSTSAVPGGTWAPVARDKFGTWYVTGFVPEAESDTITVTGYSSSNTPVTLSNINTLNISVTASARDGVFIQNGGTGIATLSISVASPAVSGVVTTESQSFAGAKNFLNTLSINSTSYLSTDAFYRTFLAPSGVTPVGYSAFEVNGTNAKIKQVLYTIGGEIYDISMFEVWYGYSPTLSLIPYGALFSQEDVDTVGWDINLPSTHSRMLAGYFSAGVKFICNESGTDYEGETGTLGLSATVKGGIITDLGTGGSASNGQIYIGNGSGFTLATLTAGNGITITNGSGSITIAAATQMSLTADGSGLKLSGDSATPGNNYFYGTDGSGTKGWYSTSGFGTTQEQVEDWVANLITASTSVNKSYNDGAGTLSLSVIAESSVEVGGGGVRLVGDTASPGNSKLYGTNGSGTRGWYDQPTGSYTNEEAQDAVGTILVDTDTINFTYDDGVPQIIADVRTQMSVTSDATGVKLVSDASTPGNSKYYGTDSGGTKGYHSLPTDFLNYVSPPAYSDSSGTINDYSYDSTYVYLCVATDTWKRWAFDSGFLPEPP